MSVFGIGLILSFSITVSVYDFVQGYEAMNFQTAVKMIREMNFNINHNPLHELYTGL